MTGFRRNFAFSQRSTGVCDIQRGVYSMYVYCDLCMKNIVGDTKVPLLQIVPIRGDHGDYVCERYETSIYAPMHRKNISDIKIDITDDTGRKIPFQSVKTIVTLHLIKHLTLHPVMSYQQYYTNQVGCGQSIYTCRWYQRGHGPLEFTITGIRDEYLDLNSAYLHLTVSISVGGVTNLTEDDKVTPVNNWGKSLFSQVDVSLNGKLVSSPSNTYAYRAYIETLLTFGKAYKKTFLTNSMWYKDTAGHMNNLWDENVGTTKRNNLTAHGNKLDMIGYIHDDVFRQRDYYLQE